MSAWRRVSSSYFAGSEIVDEYDDESGIYRTTLVSPITDVSTNRWDARRRLADKLEAVVNCLLKDTK